MVGGWSYGNLVLYMKVPSCPLDIIPTRLLIDSLPPSCSSSGLAGRQRTSPTSWSSTGTSTAWPERPRHTPSTRASPRPSGTVTPAVVEKKIPDTPGQHFYPQSTRILNVEIAQDFFYLIIIQVITIIKMIIYYLFLFFILMLFEIYFYCIIKGANGHAFHYDYTLDDYMWEINTF